VYQQFMEHPSGLTKKKLHVVYLKALGLAHKEIERIARTSADSVTRYLKDYDEGGLSALGVSRTQGPVSSWQPYQDQIKSLFLKQPPPTGSEASHEIEVRTGIKPGPRACRDFMRKRPGMKFRKMAVIPAKADPEKQAEFLSDQLEPLLEEAKQDQRKVFFVDAAHGVRGAVLGMLGCLERLFLKSSSGRRRYHVWGTFSVKGTT
jgi:transposase